MHHTLFNRFAPAIQGLTDVELRGDDPALFDKLRIDADDKVTVCYAPFEHLNPAARLVIVGITPGKSQMLNALREARNQMRRGATTEKVLHAALQTAAFSGPTRKNLIDLLDHVGVSRWLNLGSSAELFDTAADSVQWTSVLRNPVFHKGANYNGTPSMLRNPVLRKQLIGGFGQDARQLPNAVFVALGGKAAEALSFLADEGLIEERQILGQLPHPSNASAERVAYFLGRKAKERLSVKTDPNKLDIAREAMTATIATLIAKRP